MLHYKKHVFICTNQKLAGKTCCGREGEASQAFDYIKDKLLDLGLWGAGAIRVSKSGCLGRCSLGPCLLVYPEGVWYRYTSLADIDAIIESHLCGDVPVDSLLLDDFDGIS